MHPPIRLIAVVALSFALTSQCATALTQGTVGEVTSVKGVAKLSRGGNEINPRPSMPIEVRGTLSTAAKAELTVTFRDGSELILSESSSYTIDRYAMTATTRRRAAIGLWSGHIRAIVDFGTGRIPDFEVHTPNATAAVGGTEFETAYIAGRPSPEDRTCLRYTTVGVFHGVVAVANISNPAQAVEVTEGYETTVACEAPATSPAPLGMEEMGAPGCH